MTANAIRNTMRFRILTILAGLALCLGAATAADAKIIFNGRYEGFAPFYDSEGWKNGQIARDGKLVPAFPYTGKWPDIVSFYGADNPWLSLHASGGDRVRLENDPTSPNNGLVARFEVRPGDYTVTGDGAQFVDMWQHGSRLPVTGNSGHEFYAIAVKLPADWRPPEADIRNPNISWGIFAQLHSPNIYAGPPAIALSVTDAFHLSMDSGDLLRGGTLTRNADAQRHEFSNGALNPGKWVKFIIDVNWAYDSTGFIKIYRSDEGSKQFNLVLDLENTPTLTWRTGSCMDCQPHYWAVGYYRARGKSLTSVLWLSPMVRGTTFDEVKAAAFDRN